MAHNSGTDRSGDEAVRQEATTLESVFDPTALEVLQEAFEEAWAEVHADPVIRTDEHSARDMIAKRIVDAARGDGERDPGRLKRHALMAFEV